MGERMPTKFLPRATHCMAIAVLCAFFALAACSDSGSSSAPFQPENDPSAENDSTVRYKYLLMLDTVQSQEVFDSISYLLTEFELEFEANYEYLNLFYLFAHSDSLKPAGTNWYNPLGKRSDYLGKGTPLNRPDSVADTTTFINSPLATDIVYMYKSLNDKYALYIPPIEVSGNAGDSSSKKVDGNDIMDILNDHPTNHDLGVNLTSATYHENPAFAIAQVYIGSAAEKEGLEINDTIVEVNGGAVTSLKAFEEASKKEKISLKVIRGSEEKKFDIAIADYPQPIVTYNVVDSIAIIHIGKFDVQGAMGDSGTYGEFLSALKATEFAKSMVLDLRGNGGGNSIQCRNVSSEFLKKGDTLYIDYTTLSDFAATLEKNKQIVAGTPIINERAGKVKDKYTVILADSETASCAEITAMTLASNRQSVIIGQKTAGKASSFVSLPTYLSGFCQLTFSLIFDKNGKTYHMMGIEPDIALDDYEQMMDTALVIAKEAKMKRNAGYGTTFTEMFAPFKE